MNDVRRVTPATALKLNTSTYILTNVFMNIRVSTCSRTRFRGEGTATVARGGGGERRTPGPVCLTRGVVVGEEQHLK